MPAAVHDAVKEQCTRKLTFKTFDVPASYDSRILEARDILFGRLRSSVSESCWNLLQRFKGVGPRVLLIQRAPPDPFYATEASEAPSSGAQRRLIPNLDAVVGAVCQVHDNLAVATLEGLQLADQMALFSTADVVIAQHGAALGNLVWMRRNTCVIEIANKEVEQLLAKHDFYGRLADLLGIPFIRVWQRSSYAPVDLDLLREAVASAIMQVSFR